jgi:hypothetical protein
LTLCAVLLMSALTGGRHILGDSCERTGWPSFRIRP